MVDELEIRKLIGEGYVDSIIKSLNDGETEKALKVSQELLNDNNGLMGGKDKVTFNDVVDSIKTYLTSELVNLLDDKLKNNTLNDKTLDCIKEIANKNGVLQFHDYKAERELAKFYRDEYKKIPVRTHTKLQKPYMIKL